MRVTHIIQHLCSGPEHKSCQNINYSPEQFDLAIARMVLERPKEDPLLLEFSAALDDECSLEGTMLVGLDHYWSFQDLLWNLIANADPSAEGLDKLKSIQFTIH